MDHSYRVETVIEPLARYAEFLLEQLERDIGTVIEQLARATEFLFETVN